MKRIVFAAAMLVAVVLSRRADACLSASYLPAGSCFNIDPCAIQGNTGSQFEICGTLSGVEDSRGTMYTINCPSCPSGSACGASVCDPSDGFCGPEPNDCVVQCSANQCGTIPIPYLSGGGPSPYTIQCGQCTNSLAVCNNGLCCVPTTCQAQGYECGSPPDGCGSNLSCGSCVSGQVCAPGNLCCTPNTCASLGYRCGQASDGCGGTLQCGNPPQGQACVNNQVTSCTHTTCAAQNLQCGFAPDGNCQGETLECGFCGNGYACTAGACVLDPSAPAVPHYGIVGLAGLLGLAAMVLVGRKRR